MKTGCIDSSCSSRKNITFFSCSWCGRKALEHETDKNGYKIKMVVNFQLLIILGLVIVGVLVKFKQRNVVTKHIKFQKITRNSGEKISKKRDHFSCPTYEELNKVPKSCYPEKYSKTDYKAKKLQLTSLIPIYPPSFPGPSEQTHGFREVLTAAKLSNYSITISNFTSHAHDHLTSKSHKSVPFGARIDSKFLCKFVELRDQKQKIDSLVYISNHKLNLRVCNVNSKFSKRLCCLMQKNAESVPACLKRLGQKMAGGENGELKKGGKTVQNESGSGPGNSQQDYMVVLLKCCVLG